MAKEEALPSAEDIGVVDITPETPPSVDKEKQRQAS
jgi:hypothetical protein